jgi:hypothetical protein
MTATDTFTLIRNVYKTFTLVIPDFTPSTTLQAISSDITTGIATPSLGYSASASDIVGTTYGLATPTIVTAGGTTHTYNALASNCQILETVTSSFSSTSTSLGIGSSGSNSYKTWIPFTVNETGPVISATITFYAAEASALTTAGVKIGCELAGNPVAPTGISLPDYYNDLNSRIMTTNFTTDANIAAWVTGAVPYTYDVTPQVNEVLALSSWATGHILAILCKDYGSTIGVNRQIASYQNGTYTKPVLTVTI